MNVEVKSYDHGVDSLHPGDMAHQLESLPSEERKELWATLPTESRGEVIPYLHDGVARGLLEGMAPEDIRSATSQMETGDIAEVIELVADDIAQDIVDSLSQGSRSQLEQTLLFDESMAGRLLDYDGIVVTSQRTVDQVISHIRNIGLPPYCDSIFLVGKNVTFKGVLSLAAIFAAKDGTRLSQMAVADDFDIVDPTMSKQDLARLFRQKHYVSLPVVANNGRLLGRITLDDAIDVLQDEADHQLMGMAGLGEEEDLFAPVLNSARRRAIWLGINLLTALLASWVIGIFEGTLEQVVALAVLMPVVASMGGIAGSQTLTLVIRGQALGKITNNNQGMLLRKELAVGLCNGLVWSLAIAAIGYLWFADWKLSAVLSIAIFINLLAAACAGLIVPVVLDKLNIDPALSGSVVLTTVTDIIGFFTFLGLGSLWLVN